MLGLWKTNFALQEERGGQKVGGEPCHWTSAMGLPSNPSRREVGGGNAPQSVLLPVHLAPKHAHQCARVNDDLHAVLLDDLVEPAWLGDVLEVVGHPGATFRAETDLEERVG